ncbi:hypothetical protein, partial [Streptomyces yanii]|uniref:hypothetical protein n=1 Tax=Streptomyces yanii TaxID=78510 RepID=UPI0031E7615B
MVIGASSSDPIAFGQGEGVFRGHSGQQFLAARTAGEQRAEQNDQLCPRCSAGEAEQGHTAAFDASTQLRLEIQRRTYHEGGRLACDRTIEQGRQISDVGGGTQKHGPGANRYLLPRIVDDDVGDQRRSVD